MRFEEHIVSKFYPISPRLLKRNYGIIVFLICVPFLQVILTLLLLIWLKRNGENSAELIKMFSLIIIASALVIALIITISVLILRPIYKLHKKYTYIEIAQKVVIFSRYSGRVKFTKNPTIYLKVRIIPLDDFRSIQFVNYNRFLCTGKVLEYLDTNIRLRYTIWRGSINFENWWLNENGYEEIDEFKFTCAFENPQEIMHNIRRAASLYDSYLERRQVTTFRKVKVRKK